MKQLLRFFVRSLVLAILINSYQFWMGVLFYEMSHKGPSLSTIQAKAGLHP